MPFDGYLPGGADSANFLQAMLSDGSGGVVAPAAIIVETVQGEGGLNAARPEWIRRIARIAKKHGAHLIVDDIQAGVGRTGTFFPFEEMGVSPDIVTMAKSLSGFGLPMALVLVRLEHDVFGPAEHNGTFRGDTHAFVIARVAIENFWADDSVQRDLGHKAVMLTTGLKEVADVVPRAKLKCRGLMQGVVVVSGDLAAEICAWAHDKGLVIETSGNEDQVVKVLAPLATPVETFRKGFNIPLDATRAASPSSMRVPNTGSSTRTTSRASIA